MPVASSDRSPLASLPSHSNAQYGRANRQAAAAYDDEKGGGGSEGGSMGGGKGPAATAATAAGLGKDRRAAAAEAADSAAPQPSQQAAEPDLDADSQELLDDAAGMMQADDSSAGLSTPALSSQSSGGVPAGGSAVGGGGGSHKRKKKGAVGQKRAAIVGAAAASALAKAERKAGGPQDGTVDAGTAATAAPAAPAPRGGNVQPGHGGTRKRKQKEEEAVVEPGDVLAVLPVGLKLWCKHYSTGKYHPCKVLERKSRAAQQSAASQQHTAAVRSLADMGGIVGLPEPLASLAVQLSDHSHIYYIHYIDWDRRMDEWTTRDRMILQSQIALIAQPKGRRQGQQQSSTAQQQQQQLQRQASEEKEETDQSQSADVADRFESALTLGPDGDSIVGSDGLPPSASSSDLAALLPPSSSPSPPPVSDGLLVGVDSLVASDSHGGNMGGGHGNFTEADLQAHEEATKVKNVDAISFGPYSMSTWYYSPFPPEYSRYSILFFCEYCLSFFGVESELQRHARRCTLRHPPGYEIYRSQEKGATVSMFEVDGQRETVYCQNLCYLAKLFLDHKTLEFDATPFLFYVLCERDPLRDKGYHIVGYFSKEKISATGYNLAWSATDTRRHTHTHTHTQTQAAQHCAARHTRCHLRRC